MNWLKRFFVCDPGDATVLDHLPVNTLDRTSDRPARVAAIGDGLSHDEKLRLALERRGKPFVCAADGLPHEIERGAAKIVRIESVDEAWDAALLEAAERALLDTMKPAARNVAPILRKPR